MSKILLFMFFVVYFLSGNAEAQSKNSTTIINCYSQAVNSLPLFYATGSSQVLVVINEYSRISKAIGKYYQQKRNIPTQNICYIRCSTAETITRLTYESKIMIPVARYLQDNNLVGQIAYIVLTKGIPLRIGGTKGLQGNRSSVDSELTLLKGNMPVNIYGFCRYYGIDGVVPNPYYLGGYNHFDSHEYPIYLVTRLTGYTIRDIMALIDRGCHSLVEQRGMQEGKDRRQKAGYVPVQAKGQKSRAVFVLDATTKHSIGNTWIKTAWIGLQRCGFKTCYDDTKKYLMHQDRVIGYCGWGSNDPEADGIRFLHNRWLPGAIAVTFVSSSGRTFDEPPKRWRPGGSFKNLLSYHGGSPQSLAGDLIREGVTGIDAYVYEPYLESCTHPHILFTAYTNGYNLAESYYLATPYLSWQNVIVGDPLCTIDLVRNKR
ncbi:MAG: TIGR03790 family protein [bacterium]